MRRNARVDRNQTEIVEFIRNYGGSVLITSQLKNCFDILVGYNGFNIIVEIKDGLLTPSKRKLTDGEEKFRETWKGGKYYIVNNLLEIENILKSYDKII
jgi:hypothetical protein